MPNSLDYQRKAVVSYIVYLTFVIARREFPELDALDDNMSVEVAVGDNIERCYLEHSMDGTDIIVMLNFHTDNLGKILTMERGKDLIKVLTRMVEEGLTYHPESRTLWNGSFGLRVGYRNI